MSVLERVKQEKIELDEKLTKLTKFLDDNEFNHELIKKIGKSQHNLLKRQEMIMKEYSNILRIRIEEMTVNGSN